MTDREKAVLALRKELEKVTSFIVVLIVVLMVVLAVPILG